MREKNRKENFKRSRGAVLVWVAASMVVLFGAGALTLDYGRLVMTRWRLQTAADAASLAGAWELGNAMASQTLREASATQVAAEVATDNKSEGSYSVDFPDALTCRVTAQEIVGMTFARILGITSSAVSARAAAQISSASSSIGLRPLGIEEPETGFVFGEQYLLKIGPHDPSDPEDPGYQHHGNFHALAFGGKGANNFREKLKFGYDAIVKEGMMVTTEPGNMSGPTEDGIDYIIALEIIKEGVDYILDEDGRISWDWYSTHLDDLYESPRLITLPVVAGWEVYGRKEVEVVGFASFFLEGVEGTGKDSRVIGRFVERVIPGSSGGGSGSFGAYSVSLIQ
ncbi:pilus assembly protein TadG-related protein [Aminobacterium sp. MB27-C1]|jgi:hypothetical protein|uniref:pilus assembly protein TadG-related protein n=1 Tax=unclassified Aminobacterium TaxID=2685012 RepID=UPI001BCD9946|nr:MULTISPECIES: pilus assembly protein TadG-related protein [unclassified Aminobacterium]MEA4877435.1 pilus assembly protein TadG-related protein [Aminobacterium sp.]WMI72325.1 pilus assembly protein TadG-related protein [Aminobacterium sp. MB27-C1]